MGNVNLFLKLYTQSILDILLVLFQLNVIFEEYRVVIDDLRVFNIVSLYFITQSFGQVDIRLGKEVMI
jgi:hypothetical protein